MTCVTWVNYGLQASRSGAYNFRVVFQRSLFRISILSTTVPNLSLLLIKEILHKYLKTYASFFIPSVRSRSPYCKSVLSHPFPFTNQPRNVLSLSLKVKVYLSLILCHTMKAYGVTEVHLLTLLTLILEWDEFSGSRPGRLIPEERANG
jgi:hypothetical protein